MASDLQGLAQPALAPHAIDPDQPLEPAELRQAHEAFQQGHDADGLVKETAIEAMDTKGSPSSGTASIDERDLEKADNNVVSSSGEKNLAEEEAPKDPNIVDWDGPDDPENPQNWAKKRKWAIVGVMSAITFATPLASTIFAPGVPLLMKEFNSSSTLLASFVVSVYLLGFVFGPLVVAPMSELYGRVPVLNVTNVLFLIFTIACAVSSDLPMFIVFRFLAGCVGSTPLTVGGGIIADVFKQEQRGAAMAIWSLGPLVGPVAGPVAGGYLAQAKGWRWVFWVLAILIGVLCILCILFVRETYAVILLERKAKKLRQETGNSDLYSRLDKRTSPKDLFLKSIIRPSKMLVLSPIVFLLSLHISIVYGYLYLLFTTFPYVFAQQYGFSTGSAGLVYLGLGIGSMLGLVVTGVSSDRILKAKSKNGVMKPEYRLPPLVVGSFCVPIGLFWYSWSAYEHTQFMVPIIGSGLVGIGLLATFMPVMTYLVDAFPLYAASATAANTILRSLFGALLPLAGQPLFDTLGLNWGGSLLAFISVALIPIPFLFMRYGEQLRTSKRFQLDL